MADLTASSPVDSFMQSANAGAMRLAIGLDIIDPVSLTYATTLSPVFSDGSLRTCTMTGNATLNVPSSASSGNVWRGVFLASGGARNLTLAAGFKTLTGGTYSATIASGSIRIIDAYYNGTVWLVIKNQEFAL